MCVLLILALPVQQSSSSYNSVCVITDWILTSQLQFTLLANHRISLLKGNFVAVTETAGGQ